METPTEATPPPSRPAAPLDDATLKTLQEEFHLVGFLELVLEEMRGSRELVNSFTRRAPLFMRTLDEEEDYAFEFLSQEVSWQDLRHSDALEFEGKVYNLSLDVFLAHRAAPGQKPRETKVLEFMGKSQTVAPLCQAATNSWVEWESEDVHLVLRAMPLTITDFVADGVRLDARFWKDPNAAAFYCFRQIRFVLPRTAVRALYRDVSALGTPCVYNPFG